MLKRILVTMLLSIFLCGCTRDNREQISFSSWGSITEVQILQKIINDFEKQNPEIKVNFMHIPQNYFQKIHLLFASNTAPDVIFINNLYLPVYSNELEDLSEMSDKNIFFEKSIQAMSLNGQLKAIPRDISNFVFYFNKNIVNKEITNFEQFDELIKSISSNKHYGVSYERDIFYAEPYILTLGYDEGIKYYLNLEGKYAPKPSDSGSFTQAQMFLNGELAFYLSGRWMYPKIKESANFSFGIMPFPGKTYSDASGWAISKNTKHLKAAKEFVNYLSSKECIDYFTETGLIIPARKDSARLIQNTDGKAFLDAVQHSEIRKIDRNYGKNRDEINKKLFK